uniref:Uncharacterized protein n=1 Tax=Romanomermis culicivorax TaxID=13658 RepID=A0A915IMC1_ROMCU
MKLVCILLECKEIFTTAYHRQDYNIHLAMQIAELERWFFATFEFWPTNPMEPITVPMGNVGRA